MSLLLLALVSFIAVFAMAFQSRNINSGQYVLAAFGSMFIGLSQAFVWNTVTAEGAGLAAALVYSVGGGVGCISAMWTHKRFVTKGADAS